WSLVFKSEIQVQVDKRITFNQLKKELAPLIGVPSTGFIVYELTVTLGRALRRGEYRVKLFLLQFFNFITESVVTENLSNEITFQNGVSPGRVYLDHLLIDFSREMYVEPLKEIEKKKFETQRQLYVIRWHPSQCLVDPTEEIILDKGYSRKHFFEKLSKFSGIPKKYLHYTENESFPVEFDIEYMLEWNAIKSSIYPVVRRDGNVLYYKDSREKMKKLTAKERSEIQEVEEARLKRITKHKLELHEQFQLKSSILYYTSTLCTIYLYKLVLLASNNKKYHYLK
uniref:Ubiquitin carboxyl-terminal hydrolase 47 C-terminal domain-containing protein n=1 Tax=Amphimedon queenslandica TaxID=400682 RepID=A0A1X7UGQ4_AMPQE